MQLLTCSNLLQGLEYPCPLQTLGSGMDEVTHYMPSGSILLKSV